ncbi:unnamed protein product [Nippostrongylus brasiliensis]|uniref:Tetratricopeptide repeat protein 30 n=1 Tax=Nippostrongylus brasiliensis TaxID=27835 RepID=A0A0N4Y867_NIPBR|nr:unnamed protein product [Nippostrongylus brasiliensis]
MISEAQREMELFPQLKPYYITTAFTFQMEGIRALTVAWNSRYEEASKHLKRALHYLTMTVRTSKYAHESTVQYTDKLYRLIDEEGVEAASNAVKVADLVLNEIVKKLPEGAFNMPPPLLASRHVH